MLHTSIVLIRKNALRPKAGTKGEGCAFRGTTRLPALGPKKGRTGTPTAGNGAGPSPLTGSRPGAGGSAAPLLRELRPMARGSRLQPAAAPLWTRRGSGYSLIHCVFGYLADMIAQFGGKSKGAGGGFWILEAPAYPLTGAGRRRSGPAFCQRRPASGG